MSLTLDRTRAFDRGYARSTIRTWVRLREVEDAHRRRVVDVMGRYSNSTQQMKRIKRTLALSDQDWPAREAATLSLPRRLEHRLSTDETADLVAAYVAGATGRQLAERYGLARSSVLAILREQGVAVRHPRMTAAQCAEVVELYRQGMRQVDLAQRFGRSKGHIWHVLRRAGAL